MILSAFVAAFRQLGDRRFLWVLVRALALTLALMAGFYAGLVALITIAVPDTLWLPWVGQFAWMHWALSLGTLALMVGLSVFLMIPVAGLFSGLFLDDVAQAVEARHYPNLPPVPHRGFYQNLVGSVNFLGVLIVVNLLALLGYFLLGPFGPLMFWAVNGYLLGREYFQMVAERRLSPAAAKSLRAAHAGKIWLAGALMAAPLSVPFVNLLVPVLGVATFTHIFHRLGRR